MTFWTRDVGLQSTGDGGGESLSTAISQESWVGSISDEGDRCLWNLSHVTEWLICVVLLLFRSSAYNLWAVLNSKKLRRGILFMTFSILLPKVCSMNQFTPLVIFHPLASRMSKTLSIINFSNRARDLISGKRYQTVSNIILLNLYEIELEIL